MISLNIPWSFFVGSGLLLIFWIAHWIHSAFISGSRYFDREDREEAKQQARISKALERNDGEAASDTANIDLKLEKLKKGTPYDTRRLALQHVEAYLGEYDVGLTEKQARTLVDLLSYQKEDDVLYNALRLLCRYKEVIKPGEENVEHNYMAAGTEDKEEEKEERKGEGEGEKQTSQWLRHWWPALQVWVTEFLVLVGISGWLDNMSDVGLISTITLSLVVAGFPIIKIVSHWRDRIIWWLAILALISMGFSRFAEKKHNEQITTCVGTPLSEYGSDFTLQIIYPEWLTIDDLDSDGARGKQVVLKIENGKDVGIRLDYQFDTIRVRDADENLDIFPLIIEDDSERNREFYVQVADEKALSGGTAVITPLLTYGFSNPPVVAENLTMGIRLERPIWRTLHEISQTIAGVSSTGSILGILLTLLRKVLRE
jgi:hypothetical protein